MEFFRLTAHELIDKLREGETSPLEIAVSLKKRINEVDSKVKAYVRVERDLIQGQSPCKAL